MNQNLYHRHRFPAEIISHCVWLYNSFSLSLRGIEKRCDPADFQSARERALREMMLYRGIEVTYESIRDWVHSRVPLRRKTTQGRSPSSALK